MTQPQGRDRRYFTAILLDRKVKKDGAVVWVGEVLYDLKRGDTVFFNAVDIEKGSARGRVEWQLTQES